MGTLSIKVSSGNLETYEALFLQLTDPRSVAPVERVDLTFGDVTQVFPSAFGLMAAYIARSRDRSRRPLVTRNYGANPQSAKLERALDAVGFPGALLGEQPALSKPGAVVVPLLPIEAGTAPDEVAARVLDAVTNVAQPTRDAKEGLFVIITELVENVVLHANLDSPAFLCGQLSAQKKKLELCLADAGIGIRASIEGGKDAEAIRRVRAGESALAVAREAGATSKGEGHNGLGLFVASAAAPLNRGMFRLSSGTESLLISREGEKHRRHASWQGTVVNVLFNLDKLGTLLEVYRSLPLPLSAEDRFLIDEAKPEGEQAIVALREDGPYPYLGSRVRAQAVRARLLEAVRAGKVAVADLDGVASVAPCYADECFGVLLDALGEEQFRRSVVVRNASESAKLLIEAILERRVKRVDREVGPSARPAAKAEPALAAASGEAVEGAELAQAAAEESIEGGEAGSVAPGDAESR